MLKDGERIFILTDLDSSTSEIYTILGAWDGDPDKNILSYLTPLAQAMVGKKPGEDLEFDMDGTKKRFRVDSIEAVAVATAAEPVTA